MSRSLLSAALSGKACLAVLLAVTASTSHAAEQPVVVSFQDAKFAPASSARPNLAQIAVLRGDPAKGPSDMLMKMPRGEGQLHVHTSDYRLSLVSGVMKHWTPENGRASAKSLGPGSYWFQPGGQAHADDCLSDECLMFISWTGPRDGRVWTPPTPE